LKNNNSNHQKNILFKTSKATLGAIYWLALSLCLFFLFPQNNIQAQNSANIISEDGDGILGISSLMNATIDSDLEAVKFFSKLGSAYINKKNIGGANALHIASRNGDIKIVKILIESGANINSVDNEGWTPLMRAAISGHSNIVAFLLENNADASKKNSIGQTVIISAASSSCSDCLKVMFLKYNFPEYVDKIILQKQLEQAASISYNRNDLESHFIIKEYLSHNKAKYKLKKQNKDDDSSGDSGVVIKVLEDKKTPPVFVPYKNNLPNHKKEARVYKYHLKIQSQFKGSPKKSGQSTKSVAQPIKQPSISKKVSDIENLADPKNEKNNKKYKFVQGAKKIKEKSRVLKKYPVIDAKKKTKKDGSKVFVIKYKKEKPKSNKNSHNINSIENSILEKGGSASGKKIIGNEIEMIIQEDFKENLKNSSNNKLNNTKNTSNNTSQDNIQYKEEVIMEGGININKNIGKSNFNKGIKEFRAPVTNSINNTTNKLESQEETTIKSKKFIFKGRSSNTDDSNSDNSNNSNSKISSKESNFSLETGNNKSSNNGSSINLKPQFKTLQDKAPEQEVKKKFIFKKVN
jgi:hypothetical protein